MGIFPFVQTDGIVPFKIIFILIRENPELFMGCFNSLFFFFRRKQDSSPSMFIKRKKEKRINSACVLHMLSFTNRINNEDFIVSGQATFIKNSKCNCLTDLHGHSDDRDC